MDTLLSPSTENLTSTEAGSSIISNLLEMDAATLMFFMDEVRCPSRVPLDLTEVAEDTTLDLMDGARLGEAKGGVLDGALGGIKLDAALGFGTGNLVNEGRGWRAPYEGGARRR
jgi:hypothetical protein